VTSGLIHRPIISRKRGIPFSEFYSPFGLPNGNWIPAFAGMMKNKDAIRP
jgi:hypothetical protein